MLLVSVDNSYGKNLKSVRKSAATIFKKNKVEWPNVWEPDGWDGVQRAFNLSGYGLTLVGADGKVVAIDIREAELEKQLKRITAKRSGGNGQTVGGK